MDPLHVAIAIVPVAMYLLLVGWINLSSRPFVATGARDLAALAVAVSGFMIVGPIGVILARKRCFCRWWLGVVAAGAALCTAGDACFVDDAASACRFTTFRWSRFDPMSSKCWLTLIRMPDGLVILWLLRNWECNWWWRPTPEFAM